MLATAFEVSESDQAVIADELATAFELEGPLAEQQKVELADVPCTKLFQDYWRTLTADPQPDWGVVQ